MKELALYLGDAPLGKVRVESVRGKEVFSFAYDEVVESVYGGRQNG